MARITGDGLGPESTLRAGLLAVGMDPEFNAPDLAGRPDIVFRKERLDVFVHGCFWHACESHWRCPGTRSGFWAAKADANRRRDEEVSSALRSAGWTVVVVWEHDLKHGADTAVARIESALADARAEM